jgi:hypothetical protein
MSPTQQIGKGQGCSPQLPIQPDTEVMQGHLGRQACLKASQGVGALTAQPEGVMQFVIDGLNNLPYSRQPAPQPAGPRVLTIALGRTDYLSPIAPIPVPVLGFTLKALVHHIVALGGSTQSGQPGMGPMTASEAVLCQPLIRGAGCADAETSDDSLGID